MINWIVVHLSSDKIVVLLFFLFSFNALSHIYILRHGIRCGAPYARGVSTALAMVYGAIYNLGLILGAINRESGFVLLRMLIILWLTGETLNSLYVLWIGYKLNKQ